MFIVSAMVSVLSTFMAMIVRQPVHALLYFTLSLLALSMCLFNLGAHFAAVIELIIYAGAIMVLFVFVVMLLNPARDLSRKDLRFPGVLFAVLVAEMFWLSPAKIPSGAIVADFKFVMLVLFKQYGTLVELASFVLLAGLISAYRVARK